MVQITPQFPVAHSSLPRDEKALPDVDRRVRTILVVDDEEQPRRLLGRIVESAGYSSALASSAAEARACLQGRDFHLILCDVTMPGESGLDLVREVMQAYPGTAVLMVSGNDDPELTRTALSLGSYGYVLKPFTSSEVLINVANALRRRDLEIENRAHLEQLEHTVSERTRELHAADAAKTALLASITSILIGVDEQDRVTQWNSVAEVTFGRDANSVVGGLFKNCGIKWNWEGVQQAISQRLNGEKITRLEEIRYTRPDGKEGFLDLSVNRIKDDCASPKGFLLLGSDITERKILEGQLRQAQKLESIGQLAAGIAHEINTPTQYVGDNTRFLQDSFGDLLKVIRSYDRLLEASRSGGVPPSLLAEIDAVRQTADLEFLMQEIPAAIAQSLEGIERVSKIVRSMKEFAFPAGKEKVSADLNKAIESTITVARNEWKYVAEMRTDLDPDLPLVPCLLGDLNQVFLNLIINAAHAIAAKLGSQSHDKGTITISTRREGDWVVIRVQDSGTGIPEAVQPRIFDPFFTTKEVGKGTGQGLAISHSVIEKHGGTIAFETQPGEGTTFAIRLPLLDSPTNRKEEA
ncbi:MAG: ATP-binding protein [Acidobacteriota bacterium]